MKKKMQFLPVLLAILLLMGLMVGCSAEQQSDLATKEAVKIGVIQYGSHASLDHCYTGLIAGLDGGAFSGKYTVDLENANFESATCDTLAASMVLKDYDVVVAIATPAAVSVATAAASTDLPIVFCAVSDPVSAGLVASEAAPGGNCTGTADSLDFAAQVQLIQTLQPDAKKIGVLYTTSEANSVSQLNKLTDIAKAKGLEIVASGVQTAEEVPQAAAALASKVDCINNLTDNNVISCLPAVLKQANTNKIPVYGSEVEQVKKGCLAAVGLDYIALGKKTGEMVNEILSGKKPGEIPVVKITDSTLVMNQAVLDSFKIKLPEAYAEAQLIETEKD